MTTAVQQDTFTVSSGFIGSFKLGDNLNHTLDVLTLLYQTQRADTSSLLCKPITILLASVCEAILCDFHDRMKRFTREGVGNVAESVLDYVRGTHIDEFSKYIASAKKHNLLKDAGPRIYDSLEDLRKLRNRVHIQNKKGHFEPDDGHAFTMSRQIEAEKTLERVLKLMAERHARPASAQGYVADFQLPWSEHF